MIIVLLLFFDYWQFKLLCIYFLFLLYTVSSHQTTTIYNLKYFSSKVNNFCFFPLLSLQLIYMVTHLKRYTKLFSKLFVNIKKCFNTNLPYFKENISWWSQNLSKWTCFRNFKVIFVFLSETIRLFIHHSMHFLILHKKVLWYLDRKTISLEDTLTLTL